MQVNFRKAFGMIILGIISLVIIGNVYLIYTMDQRNQQLETKHQGLVNSNVIITIINIMMNTPEGRLESMINTIHANTANPNFNISLTTSPKWPQQAINFDSDEITEILKEEKTYIDTISYRLPSGKWLNVAFGYEPPPFPLIKVLFIIFEIIVAILLLSYAWSLNRFSSPLQQLKQHADELGMDLQAKKTPIYGPTLAKNALQSMNLMQDRLYQLVRERVASIAALSHDIKTPLTRLKLRVQMMDEKDKQVSMLNDISDIEILLSETLNFAKQDYHQEEKRRLDLVALLQTLSNDLQDTEQPVSFERKISRAIIMGQSSNLTRAFNNLIQNAILYGHRCDVSMQMNQRRIEVHFRDQGPGIPDEIQEKVFEPFFRFEKSRSRKTGGTGLGLAIARSILLANDGQITLQNLEKGLDVVVSFPVVKAVR